MNITPATLTKAFHSTSRWSLKRMMEAHSRQPFLLQTFSTYDDWTAAIAFLQVANMPDLLPTPICVMADPHTTGDENALPKAAILYDYAHIRPFNWLLNTMAVTDNEAAQSPNNIISSITKDLMLQIMQLTDYAHDLGFTLPWQAESHAFLVDKTTFELMFFDFSAMRPSTNPDLIEKDWLSVANMLATWSPWMDEEDLEAINALLQSKS